MKIAKTFGAKAFGGGTSRRKVPGSSASFDVKVFNPKGLLGMAKQGKLRQRREAIVYKGL